MAAITVDGGTGIDEDQTVVELNGAVTVIGGDIIVGGVARLVGMTDIAVVDAVVAAMQLGVSAMALTDAGGPGQIEVAMAVAALRPEGTRCGGAPLPFPRPFVIVAVDQGAIRAAGGGGARGVAECSSDRDFADREGTGLVRGRGGGGMTGDAGTGRTYFRLGDLERIIMGVSRDRQGTGMEARGRECPAGAFAGGVAVGAVKGRRIEPVAAGDIDNMTGIGTGRGPGRVSGDRDAGLYAVVDMRGGTGHRRRRGIGVATATTAQYVGGVWNMLGMTAGGRIGLTGSVIVADGTVG